MTGGDAELRQSIIDRYLRSLSEELGDLDVALGNGDFERVRFHAHRISGASVTVGAGAVTAASSAVEHAVMDGRDAEDLARLCAALSASVAGCGPAA